MAFWQHQPPLQNVGLCCTVLLASCALAQQDTFSMIQHTVQSWQTAEHQAPHAPQHKEEPAPVEFKVGELAEIKIVSGEKQGTWVPCKIASRRKALGYNVVLQFAQPGHQDMSEIPDRVLRKVQVADYEKAIHHMEEHAGTASVLAAQVEREAGRRHRANLVMIKNGRLPPGAGSPVAARPPAAGAQPPPPPPPPPRAQQPRRPPPRPPPRAPPPARAQSEDSRRSIQPAAGHRAQPAERGLPADKERTSGNASWEPVLYVQKQNVSLAAAETAGAKPPSAKPAAARQAAAQQAAAKRRQAAAREAAKKQAAAKQAAAKRAAAKRAAAREAAAKQSKQAAARRAAASQAPLKGAGRGAGEQPDGRRGVAKKPGAQKPGAQKDTAMQAGGAVNMKAAKPSLATNLAEVHRDRRPNSTWQNARVGEADGQNGTSVASAQHQAETTHGEQQRAERSNSTLRTVQQHGQYGNPERGPASSIAAGIRRHLAPADATWTADGDQQKRPRLALRRTDQYYEERRLQAVQRAEATKVKWKLARERVRHRAQEAAQCKFAVDVDLKRAAERARIGEGKAAWQRRLEEDMARQSGEDQHRLEQQEAGWKALQEQSLREAGERAVFAALDEESRMARGELRRLRQGDPETGAAQAVLLLVRSRSRGQVFPYKVDPQAKLWQIRQKAVAVWNISLPNRAIRLLRNGTFFSPRESIEDLGLGNEDIIDIEEDLHAMNISKAASTKAHALPQKKAAEVSLSRYQKSQIRWKREAGTARTWESARAKAAEVANHLTPSEIAGLLHGSHSGEPGWYSGNTEPVPRLGVPALRMQGDAYRFRPFRAGAHRTVTCWPSPLALAATWDENLVWSAARALGEELRRKGVNTLLGPAVNVQRLTRHGRSFESLAGEDPVLGARLARPFIQAVQSQGVMACAKHFAFNDQERYQPKVSYEPDERVAWELYYPPFEAAVEAGIGAIMCSDAKVNGTYSCENENLLKRDLKDTMGFRGLVVSEWDTVATLPRPSQNRSGAGRWRGLDLDMPGAVEQAAPRVSIDQNSVDSTLRVLTSMYRIGVDKFKGWTPRDGLTLQDTNLRSGPHATLAREVASHSVVLLKNNGVLPITSSTVKTITILGAAADAPPKNTLWGADYYSGGGSGHVPSSVGRASSPLEQIGRRAASANIGVLSYTGSHLQLAKQRALVADVVVVVAAATASEGEDRPSLSLDGDADALIAHVAKLRPTVVLLQVPGAVLTPWRGAAAAIASLFLGGEATGSAWASVLFGDVVPAAKLPVMFPMSEADTIQRQADQVVRFPEGLLTSYRSPVLRAAFPFGHGLSYTSFSYGKPRIELEECPARHCISLTIRNQGNYPGSEVAQAYILFSAKREPHMPNRVLRGFEKTSVLQPGEEEVVTFAMTTRDFSMYHSGVGWVLLPRVKLGFGSSSLDVRQELVLLTSVKHAGG